MLIEYPYKYLHAIQRLGKLIRLDDLLFLGRLLI